MKRSLLFAASLVMISCAPDPSSPDGCGAMPRGDAAFSIRMVSLYPNPLGEDNYSEKVTLQNFGDAPASLSGWMLRDRENVTWDLSLLGSIDECLKKTYTSDKTAQLLNSGDELSLLAPDGTVVQTVVFSDVADGEEITP